MDEWMDRLTSGCTGQKLARAIKPTVSWSFSSEAAWIGVVLDLSERNRPGKQQGNAWMDGWIG